jgi:hypothetical protein
MTVLNQSTSIKHLFTQGLKDFEIVSRTGFSLIFVKHEIARLTSTDPAAESKHYIARHKKGRNVRAYIVYDGI